ncbi:MAG: N-acetylmuramidase domain-containing protein [Candidatus Caenarcaniphilales bacterium]|nr:N-acetylmuramidase domain-containing protein [Candidatus Caenarcaniphilales bacterium]
MKKLQSVFFKSVNQLLTPAEKDFLITEKAHEKNIEPAVLKAIVEVESSGSGFYSEGHPQAGKCKVRFEPDYFAKFTGVNPFFIPKSLSLVEAKKVPEYTGRLAYEKALMHSPASAIKATSFGLGQIMGFNYLRVGYNSLIEFKDAMEEGEYKQLEALIEFIVSDQSLLKAAQEKDFISVARLYNGAHYAERAYDKKLVSAYQALSRKKNMVGV